MEIITTRLFIEPLSNNDCSFIVELLNTKGWLKFIGNPNINTNADAIALIEKINGNENISYRTVKLKDAKTTIGIVTLIKREYLEHHDIGFAFLPGFSNKGYAYEATAAVLVHVLRLHGFTHILGETLPENSSSIKLLQRLGLAFEKEIEIKNELLHIYKASAQKIFLSNSNQ